ncbi:hypothetical protein NM688_g3471 [Phlebia brevispora]|uniref:Uncharacterized protein n=1 Tax=Phlebia brevispora TaxID=194682 RepID=A0ACC1T5L1_9APHY|nr:hypothetical protein NM688_g3471 [Phlebia brevispora]
MKILNKPRKALPPPHVVELIDKLADTPNEDLAEVLGQIDYWKWPRSDLNAWVKVLNKFDAILEEAIRDYNIDKMQMNPFTPSTKRLICEVLRFERLLLENSTNRKTFNSYDRLNSFMATSDIDVLTYALNLLLRPAQQYSAQPQVSHALNISTPRLTSLAKRWPSLHDFDIKLTALASKSSQTQIDALPNEAREVVFTFYRKDTVTKEKTTDADVFDAPAQSPRKGVASSSAPSTSSGSVVVHIDSQTLETKDAMEILADAVEAFSVPDEEKFELLCRIRTAQALTKAHSDDREKLVIIRLLATAIFSHTHVESTAFSSLFLYEPDLVQHIAELLQLDAGIDVQVQTAAIAALDAVGRYRNKVQDVLTAVNAGVNHGILMALTRKTIGEIANPESNVPQPFVEGLLSFVTYIATHASGGNMVVSAGLIPLLIQVIEVRLPNRLYAISKTMQLLDNVLYGYTNAFQLFCNARGVETLVERIEHEVNLDLEEWGPGKAASDVSVVHGKISVARSAALKHTLRSMHRMMQSSGTSEGLRGLLDSTLLKSAKKIMDNGDVFGPSILAIAINIMATFVHNEPTCLGVIQENNLPESFYRVVESGLEPAIEVIQAIPNAIGALCLNQAGQDQLAARPSIIPSLFSIFVSERHQRILQEKENAVLIGTAIEELIRHHPALKDAVFDAIKTTLTKIEELGNAYEASDDLKQYYGFLPTRSTASAAPAGDVDVEMDTDSNVQTAVSVTPAGPTDADTEPTSPGFDDLNAKPHDNSVVSYIDVFGKFLEGYFQHVPHCRDFISGTDGLERIGRLTALPCLPYDFPNSVASDSLVQVVRTMVEAATSETLAFLVKLVNESLAETKHLREGDLGQSKLLALTRVTGNLCFPYETGSCTHADVVEDGIAEANKDLRRLVTLEVRVMLLSDIYSTAGYAQGRASATLLQALTGPEAGNLVSELGSLHRSCLWENILLKNAEKSKRAGAAGNSNEDLLQLGDDPAATTSTSATGSVAEANGARILPRPPFVVPSQSLKDETLPDRNDPRYCNSQLLQHITTQLPYNILQPLFQAIVRLFQTRRNLDTSQRQRILDASSVLAEVILSHLSPRPSHDTRAVFTYYAAMLSLCSVLLIEERGHSKIANTVLLWAFFRKGGLDAIVALCRSFVRTIEQLSLISPDERTDVGSQELVHAQGGLRVALMLILTIVSSKPILDSPQTAILQTPEKKNSEPDWFEPHNFIVRTRHAILPVMREIWDAPCAGVAQRGERGG